MAGSGKLRRAHVVPRGYQRLFADGERILVTDTRTKIGRVQGTRDTFVSPKFLIFQLPDGTRNDSAEDAFGRVENLILPVLRTVATDPLTQAQHQSIVTAFALLWARSYVSEVTRRRIHEEIIVDQKRRHVEDPQLLAAFMAQYGRPPTRKELEDLVDRNAADLWSSRVLHVSKMVEYHNQALTRFRELHISVYHAPPHLEFVTSDNPVVLTRGPQGVHVGAHNRIALDDADMLFLPLNRRHAACLTTEPEPGGALDPIDVYRSNNNTWRNAVRYVASHPSVDPFHLCAVTAAVSTEPT